MSERLTKFLLALSLALVVLAPASGTALAQHAQYATIIKVLTPEPLQSSQDLNVSVRLTTDAGAPIANGQIIMSVTADIKRIVSTDANGVATFSLHTNLTPGNYVLNFNYPGDVANQPASHSTTLTVAGISNVQLKILPLGNIPIGKNVVVSMQLTMPDGTPISGEHVQLYVDGVRGASGDTDADGIVQVYITKDISTGTHRLYATYAGSYGYSPASATLDIGVYSLDIEIHTVPALQGVQFAVGDRQFTTGPDGIARLPVDSPGTYHVQLLPFKPDTGDIQAEFAGWGDRTALDFHDVTVPMGIPLLASFKISYRVSQTFIDLAGSPVEPSRITSLTFKRSDGAVFTFNDGQPRWLESNYFVRRLDGLVSSPFLYSLMSVVVNGTNVVSAQQQRFHVNRNDKWILQLLLFSAHFQAHDQLLGVPLGTSIKLQYPDGFILNRSLDGQAQTEVVSLPRGAYTVTVQSRLGFPMTAPLAMSRNQQVDLPIISYLDIVIALVLGLLIGPGLLLVGQPRLRDYILGQLRRLRARPNAVPVRAVAKTGSVRGLRR